MFAAEDGVLLALLGARVIEIIVALGRHAEIGLLDPSEHLRIELGLKHDGVEGHRFGVAILVLEVLNGRGIVSIAKPEVVVDACVAVDGDWLGNGLGHGWSGRGVGDDRSESHKSEEKRFTAHLTFRLIPNPAAWTALGGAGARRGMARQWTYRPK